jgi:hypothetical protein
MSSNSSSTAPVFLRRDYPAMEENIVKAQLEKVGFVARLCAQSNISMTAYCRV